MGNGCGSEEPVQFGDLQALPLISFCEWPQRAAVAALSPALRGALGLCQRPGKPSQGDLSDIAAHAAGDNSPYWRLLCERFGIEHCYYVPMPGARSAVDSAFGRGCIVPPLGVAVSWRQLFLDLHSLTQESQSADVEEERPAEVFKIDIAARFRSSEAANSVEGVEVVLPLHQKAQLIRKQLGCSREEAVALAIRGRRGAQAPRKQDGDFFQLCKFPGSENKENKENKENESAVSGSTLSGEKPQGEVISGEEEESEAAMAGPRCSIVAVHADTAKVLAITRQSGLREFSFNQVHSQDIAQADIYELSARRLVVDFVNGRSTSIICYGQTGSGKTFTMFGPHVAGTPSGMPAPDCSPQMRGLVPRACAEVLEAVQVFRRAGHHVRVGVSYVEVFGSEVSDLLREGRVVGQGLAGRYDASRATDRVGHRYVLDGHTEWPVETWAEVRELLRVGDAEKRRAATAMNERSTRAHAIFVLSLSIGAADSNQDISGTSTTRVRQSRFYFADLGGSEKLVKSKADEGTKAPVTMVGGEEQSRITWQEYYSHRQRIQETTNINKGLFALKRVIEALHRRSRLAHEGVPPNLLPYVPYQDSKLTMLLQEALGGAGRTLVVTTASMDPNHAAESLQTLRFAETCAEVQKQGAVDQAACVKAALEQLESDIAQVQQEIVRKERWETRLIKRRDVDTVAGDFGEQKETVLREEVVPTSVLTGAEAERERLEQLLQKKTELEGLGACSGGLDKDWRDMRPVEATDGGKGVDFRQRDKFSTQGKMKAKDFEDEAVLASAVRFLFRRAPTAKWMFGEMDPRRRMQSHELPQSYFEAAAALRRVWEERLAAGTETRSFGKAMMDRCQEWREAFRADPESRDAELASLFETCGLKAVSTATAHSDLPQGVVGASSDFEDM
mmetsp:Transcript_29822/g.65020  ORF Transcript_29822/g.65020 Transcript_29822/m.65020 type:complete len:904 (+) Transcript_29822:82-2793(+)